MCLQPQAHQRARLSSRSSPSSVGIWRCIKAGEWDALQVLNWISCWISGTSLQCMWASSNDALIFALQRHRAYVCVVDMFAFVSPSISTGSLVAHNRYVCLISGSNCFVRFCWRTSSDSVHIMSWNGFYSKSLLNLTNILIVEYIRCLFLTCDECQQGSLQD